MKKIITSILIFYSLFNLEGASYQEHLNRIWDQTVVEVDANFISGIEALEISEKLTKAAKQMLPKESLLFNFYPKGSGFDILIGERFPDIKEVEQLADEIGFDIEFSYPQRHIAQFEDVYELKDFVKRQFDREVVTTRYLLTFPTKIVTVKFVKR